MPQGRVLAPILFNLALTVISGLISSIQGLPGGIAIGTDDVASGCVGKSTQAQAMRARSWESLTGVSCR